MIERTNHRIVRWRVIYPNPNGEGMRTETLHFTHLGATLSRWLSRQATSDMREEQE